MSAVATPTPGASRDLLRGELIRKVADVLHSRHADSFAAVVRIAAIPPRDVEAMFEHDGALFIAVVGTIADRMLAPLTERPTGPSFHPQLVAFARQATDGFSGLQLRNLYRIAVANEFGGHPVRAEFYRHGPARVRDELARFMSFAQSQGFGPGMECRRAAVHFLSLLRTYWEMADVSAASDRPHVDDDLDWMVAVFLSGIETKGHDV